MKKLVKLILVLGIISGCLAGVTFAEDVPAPVDDYGLYLTVSDIDGAGPRIDVCIDAVENVSIGYFSLCVNYAENMSLTACETPFDTAELDTGNIADKPFTVKWDGKGEVLPAGENVIVSLKFEVEGDVKDHEFAASVTFAEDDPPKNPSGESIADKFTVQPELKFTFDDIAPALLCHASVGDCNSDGKMNLLDITLMMKHIAGWSDSGIEGSEGDVVNDGMLNLKDVSLMLKYVAGWNSVRLGHNDKADVIRTPTCQEVGESHLTCEVCGSEETVYPPKVPCDYRKETLKEPTCGKDGEDKYTCSMCNDVYTKVVKATGDHKYYRTVITEPTCVKKGENKFTCKVCGQFYKKSVKATGKHDYVKKVVKEANCGADGKIEYTCSMCSDSYSEKILATGKHDYYLGQCQVCGTDHPDYNGRTNVVKLQKYCDWLKKNGTDMGDGSYAYIATDESETWAFINYYYPDEVAYAYAASTYTDDMTTQLTAVVYIPLNGDNDRYEFYYLANDTDGNVLFEGYGSFDPTTFLEKKNLVYDEYFYAYDDSEFIHRNIQISKTVISNATYYAGILADNRDVGINIGDLGFVGW